MTEASRRAYFVFFFLFSPRSFQQTFAAIEMKILPSVATDENCNYIS